MEGWQNTFIVGILIMLGGVYSLFMYPQNWVVVTLVGLGITLASLVFKK